MKSYSIVSKEQIWKLFADVNNWQQCMVSIHLTDTRAKTVELTEEGEKLIKKAMVTVEKFDTNFF